MIHHWVDHEHIHYSANSDPVLFNVMQTPLKSGQIELKDLQCSETYEKTIVQFLFFSEMVEFVLKMCRKLAKKKLPKFVHHK